MDIRTACLGLLSYGEATGYDIKQRCERICSHFFAAGYGSIYPALAELAREGFVACREEPGAGGQPRKVYSITPAGREELLARLASAEPKHRVHSDFALLMFFADLLPPERVDAMIGRRLGDIRDQLERLLRLEAAGRGLPPGIAFTRGMGIAVLRATIDYLEANRAGFRSTLASRPKQEDHSFHHPDTGDPA